jgi:uncharacterized membrane protein YbhN (UPF0104 family)
MTRKRQWVVIASSVVVAVALVAVVGSYTGVDELRRVLRATSPGWLAASVACFLAYQWFRMLRTALLLRVPRTGRLFATMCLQGGANDLVLPAGTGDAALVYLLKRWHGADYARGIASLVVARVVDLALFALLFAVMLATWGSALPPMLRAVMAGMGALFAAALAGVWALARARGWRVLDRAPRAAHALARLSAELREVHARRVYAPLLLHSAAMWVLMYGSYVALLRSLAAPLDAAQVLLLYVLVFPVDLTPVKGAANFGTHEGVWFVALRVLGVEAQRAAALSFATHLLILATLLASVAVGAAGLARRR